MCKPGKKVINMGMHSWMLLIHCFQLLTCSYNNGKVEYNRTTCAKHVDCTDSSIECSLQSTSCTLEGSWLEQNNLLNETAGKEGREL